MRLPVPQPWRRTSQDEPDEPPDEHTVEVEQPDGSVIYVRPEAVDHYRPEVWRSAP